MMQRSSQAQAGRTEVSLDAIMRELRIFFATFVVSVVAFAVVGEVVPTERNTDLDIMLFPLAFVAMSALGLGVYLRRSALEPAREALRRNPEDAPAMEAWRRGHVLSFVFSESVALFGLVVRLVTGSREYALPFFVAGVAALIVWAPRRPNG
jgi:hypothetical protein